ncbi:DNA-binding transcriptional regulator, LysR family [Pasteurella testudinis DSM 23072]|uniref:DNA-binding transcriptional regulator, LysR family n=1 Tax=Pasteurella testudinis DSM 23072 TaxID=1122938 RepID=A0A1W1V6X2_9PAST|nr:LysR family transcriptional regulator [Pasteurella testudinis]SMB89092.1 DNA-binding transcriptional regulator, LysR family [Pasteurella testudinis DSM 23072]SUB50205.1 glycine cleavage system transcriptional activator [Pasteurella testudinis]
MDLNALKIFVHVAQAGSFSAASQKSGIPITTISRKTKELEQQLGVQLLERSTQGVGLTVQGQQLYEQVNFSLETVDNAARNLLGNEQALKGKLRLSMPQAFGLFWDLLHDFQTQYPDIDVHVVASNRKVDLIADGFDVAVRIGTPDTELMIVKPMMKLQLKLVATPDFIATHGKPSVPDELQHYPLCAWVETTDITAAWALGEQRTTIKPKFSCNDYIHLRHWLLQNNGIGDLPDMLAKPMIASGELVEILPDYPFSVFMVHLIYPQYRHPSAIVRAFVDFCGEWLEKHG